MRTNIFRTAYQQPENKLTYCFLSLLEHLDVGSATQLIAASGIPPDRYERLQVELLYGGREGNPDGSFTLEGSRGNITIFFENKTYRRGLDIEQIKRHIREHVDGSPSRRLLVITTDGDHNNQLAALGNSQIHFMTWHQIADAAERLSRAVRESKDTLLLREFHEYLETSDEAWRAKMPDLKLIEAHSQFLKVAPDEDRFLKECRRLTNALCDDVISPFTNEIESNGIKDAEGLVGNECYLRKAPFGQWLFFGVYHDPQDHKINHCCPVKTQTESVGWSKSSLSMCSPSAEVPVKWAFSRTR